MAHDEDTERVAAPHCRERPPRRPLIAGEPDAKAVIVGDPVQAVIRIRLAPAASRHGFEQYLRTLACVRCGWHVTGDVDYELLIACRAIADLDSALTCLRGCGGTEVASAELVLREVAGPGPARPAPALAGASGRSDAFVQAKRGRPGEPGGPGVTALLRHRDGRLEDIGASFLIGADGMHGTTGDLLNPPSHDEPGGPCYVLADLWLDGDFRGDVISVFLGPCGLVMLLPAGGGRFQCVATDHSARSGDHGGPGKAELQRLIDGCLPAPARVRQLRWSSRFLVAQRLSPPLRHGRVFTGGDCAYAHSPATGQGANCGIQDMINLGWKLAMVLRGRAAPALLGTYAVERLQVIRQLERKTEVPAYLLGSGSTLVRRLVTRTGPAVPDSRSLLDLCADLAGEVIPDYWSSPLSVPPLGPGGLQPGGSVLDMRVLTWDPGAPDGSAPRATRLHELVCPSRLNLLLTDDSGPAAVPSARLEQLQPWRELMATRLVTPDPDREEQARFFRTFGGGQSLVLVRPDSHVCFAGRQKSLPRLVTWLNTWFPPGPGGGPPVRRRQLAGRLLGHS